MAANHHHMTQSRLPIARRASDMMCPKCGCTETRLPVVDGGSFGPKECSNCGLKCAEWEAYAAQMRSFKRSEKKASTRKAKDLRVELYSTLTSLNDRGVAMFAHGLIDALSGSPEQTSLKLFLASLPKRYKALALANHSAVMRRGNI